MACCAVFTTVWPFARVSDPAATQESTVDCTRATSALFVAKGAPAQISSSSEVPSDSTGLATPESSPPKTTSGSERRK